ncbi:MAG: zinc ribbon domain-containing protein [Clostridiales Family XIII bacterium]|nr:zinc ribbon domain-containing protein [Clostridiales Family XIII bacterium]
MATYKQTCIHCGTLVERDARFCPTCGSHSPFAYLCPACRHEVEKGSQAICAGCGRALYITCPVCGGRTFVQEKCETCGARLTIHCPNKRCGMPQFFENEKCTACGKKIGPKDRTITSKGVI